MGQKKGSKNTETSSMHHSGSFKHKHLCQPEPLAAVVAQVQSLANALGHNDSVRTMGQLPALHLPDTEVPSTITIDKLCNDHDLFNKPTLFHHSSSFAEQFAQDCCLYKEGLSLSKAQVWANKCPPCFDPSNGEVKVFSKEPHTTITMDGNLQQ
ncbi:hypothetical protein CROQUDRAFT_130057 [Cronartium quercuum f. sp. fusiforme G11]|uniref:Uncharacterized protein n=1 Tax=Cronartium quercuum f. sp. fusiforme G11 TaxID=708437 RepID=A0A9P6NTI9_9BASI|nr:hypothetical protein CROQUDRAFT_130057 [Cronartium quercuum f. sp. fusiforme G11]